MNREADVLIDRLLQPEPALVTVGSTGEPIQAPTQAPVSSMTAGVTPYPRPSHSTPVRPVRAPATLSGQQLLLGLGALMLLSAAAFFLIVIWLVVGLAGQAAIMITLTGAAVVGAAAATVRKLPAAAETGAVIATGLLAIDLSAAHALGLAGLDHVPTARYWTVAFLAASVLLIGWDRLIPRDRNGATLRRVRTFVPAAAVSFTLATWTGLAVVEPSTALGFVTGFGVIAVVNAAAAALAWRVRAMDARWTAAVAVTTVSAGVAALGYVLVTASTAYDFTSPDRYFMAALLAVVPAAAAVAASPLGSRAGVSDDHRAGLVYAAFVAAVPVIGVPLSDILWVGLVALSVLVGAAVMAFHYELMATTGAVTRAVRSAGYGALLIAQPVLYGAALWLILTGNHTITDAMTTSDTGTLTAEPGQYLIVAVAAAAWTATSLFATLRHHNPVWVSVTQTGAAATVFTALAATASATTWGWVTFSAYAVNIALGCVAARRIAASRTTSSRAAGQATTQGQSEARDTLTWWTMMDLSAIVFGVLYALTAIFSTVDNDAHHIALACIAVGVLVLVYAGSPARIGYAYLGSLVISTGTAILSADAGVDTIEAYTLPLAVLLAGVGVVQWVRDHTTPTLLTMGPALSVLTGPTLLVAVGTGDEVRLALLTGFAVVTVLVGLSYRWKAPVTTGVVVLAVIAVTQGGPWIAYLPGWLTLGAAGAVLLAAGVAWERAVVAGKRANAWYHTLR